MSERVARRQFLSAALLGTGALAAGMAWPDRAAGIEPIRRDGKAKFKFSLAAYSYRKLLSGKEPELTLADFIRDCAALQLDGTELTSYYFPTEVTSEYLHSLSHLAFTLGLDISGTAVRNDFCLPPGEQRDENITHVKQWVDYAAAMGAPVIRIFSGNARGDQTPEQAHKLAVEGMEECCDYAGQHGVFLALENHGGLTATADGLLALVRDVKSDWFGINFDSGNFHSESLYDDLARIAPYAINAQIKVVVSPVKGRNEPSDFKRLAKILTDAGYRGYVVLEYEEAEDPRQACRKYLDQLREAFA